MARDSLTVLMLQATQNTICLLPLKSRKLHTLLAERSEPLFLLLSHLSMLRESILIESKIDVDFSTKISFLSSPEPKKWCCRCGDPRLAKNYSNVLFHIFIKPVFKTRMDVPPFVHDAWNLYWNILKSTQILWPVVLLFFYKF